MIKAFFWNRKWALCAYGGAIFLLLSLYAQVELTVMINKWYGGFYDLLQNAGKYAISSEKTQIGVQLFWKELLKFAYIAIPYVMIATVTSYFTRRYGLWWREAMTFDYIPRWRNVKEEIEGASQRIQEDTYRFARILESLGLQLIRSLMTLIAFLPLLWGLSKKVDIPFDIPLINMLKISTTMMSGEREVIINIVPGSLVWVALLVSLGGLVISWFVGWYLPGLEYNNQKVEAAFRKELVLGEDDKKNYCSIESLTELFFGIKINYKRLFMHYGYFDVWVNFYEQIMIIVPYIFMGPLLFTGIITLGLVVQTSNAFSKVRESLSVLIQNWTTITELRSIWKRLHEFEANLDKHQISNF